MKRWVFSAATLILAGCSSGTGGSAQQTSSRAMTALNECVATEVTTSVNAVKGQVDDAAKSSIANRAVAACDRLVDAAASEHIANVEAMIDMPATTPKQKAFIEKAKEVLATRSSAEWRRYHIEMKRGFAKAYVGIIARRFDTSKAKDESSEALAPN